VFDVACPAEHAFRVWTSGIGTSGGHTLVDIEHRGWERAGEQWRDRTRIGWQTLLPHYQKEIAHGRWH